MIYYFTILYINSLLFSPKILFKKFCYATINFCQSNLGIMFAYNILLKTILRIRKNVQAMKKTIFEEKEKRKIVLRRSRYEKQMILFSRNCAHNITVLIRVFKGKIQFSLFTNTCAFQLYIMSYYYCNLSVTVFLMYFLKTQVNAV